MMRASIFSPFRSNNNSRASSPAPVVSRPDSGVFDVVDPLSLPPSVTAAPNLGSANPHMAQTVPGATGGGHRARPISRLSLTPFRRASPSPARTTSTPIPPSSNNSPAPSPAFNPMSVPGAAPGASYLDNLSLKLGEAVQKALSLPPASSSGSSGHTTTIGLAKSSSLASLSNAGSNKSGGGNGLGLIHHHHGGGGSGHNVSLENAVLKGKKPVPSGRGRMLGSLISSELHNASHVLHDTYLHRAILRLLQRPLTNLLTSLSQSVTALILAPEFAPVVPLLTLNPTQIHALAYAGFASELLETFDALHLGRSSSHMQAHANGAIVGGDGLKPIREGLENVISKVVGPLLAAIKAELATSIEELEQAGKNLGADAGTAVEKLEQTIYRVGGLVAHITFVPVEQLQHGAATESGPACRQSACVQSLLATFEISTMWTCLKALSARKLPPSAPPKPVVVEPAHHDPALKGRAPNAPLKYQASEGSLSVSSNESTSSSVIASGDVSKLAGIQLPLSYVTPPGTPHMSPLSSPGKEPKRSSTLGILGLGNKSSTKLATSNPKGASAQTATKLPTPATVTTKLPTPPGTTKFSLSMLPSLKVQSALSSPAVSRAPSPPHDLTAVGQSSGTSSPTRRTPPAIPVPNPMLIALQLLAHDARIITTAIKRALPLPAPVALSQSGHAGNNNVGLAREAVEEAVDKMDAVVGFLEYIKEDGGRHVGISAAIPASKVEGDVTPTVDVDALMERTRKAPMLLVLPLLLRIWAGGNKEHQQQHESKDPEVATWLGLAEDEYARSCLGGFGKGEECEAIVGRALHGSKAMKDAVRFVALGSWFREWLTRSVEEAEDSDASDDEYDSRGVLSASG